MSRRYFWGATVLLIGLILLLQAMGFLPGNIWTYFWAIILILIGVGILFPNGGEEK